MLGYAAATNLRVQGQVERRIQEYQGVSLGANDYTANVSYWHYVLGGRINSSLSLQDATIDGSSSELARFQRHDHFQSQIREVGRRCFGQLCAECANAPDYLHDFPVWLWG